MAECRLCKGEGSLLVLDIWSMQRRAIQGLPFPELADDLPYLEDRVLCPECHGAEASDDSMRKIVADQGGNPFDPKTFVTH